MVSQCGTQTVLSVPSAPQEQAEGVDEVDISYLQEDSARGPRGRQAVTDFPGILQVGSKVGENSQFIYQEEKQQQEQVRAGALAQNTEVAQEVPAVASRASI